MTTKQWLSLGYAGEIPLCHHRAQNFGTMSEINAESGDFQKEKMRKSSEKEKTTHSKSLEFYRSLDYSRKVPANVFLLLPKIFQFLFV